MTLQELKTKLIKVVEMIDDEDQAIENHEEEDHILSEDEMKMLCNQLDTIVINSMEIKHIIAMTQKSPAWVRSKVSVCSSKMASIRNYFVGKIIDI